MYFYEPLMFAICFGFREIYSVFLAGNPLLCDCTLYTIKASTGRLLRDANRVLCATPPSLAGVALKKVNLSGCTKSEEYDDFYDNYYYDDYERYS